MNWEALGAVAELVGALGVIATLVYLSLQIRQNSVLLEQNMKASRTAAISATTQVFGNLRSSIIADRELTSLWYQGSQDPMSLDELDRRRYWIMMQSTVEAIAEVYSQTMASGLAPEVWETQGRQRVKQLVGTPGGRTYWENSKMGFARDFRSVVDATLGETGA